jgi:DNA-binding protein HU-beta
MGSCHGRRARPREVVGSRCSSSSLRCPGGGLALVGDAYTTPGVLDDQAGARTEGRRGRSHRGRAGQERRRRRVDAIASELAAGRDVAIAGFGKFSVSERSARDGRNPSSGETIQVAARTVAKFSAAAALKKQLNS